MLGVDFGFERVDGGSLLLNFGIQIGHLVLQLDNRLLKTVGIGALALLSLGATPKTIMRNRLRAKRRATRDLIVNSSMLAVASWHPRPERLPRLSVERWVLFRRRRC